MPVEYSVTATGIATATAIVAVVAVTLWWMLRPQPSPQPALVPQAEAANVILLPVTDYTPPELLRLAGILANETHGSVMMLHVVEIPYTLPLDAQMSNGTGHLREQLREYRRRIEESGIPVECKIIRARRAGKAILEWAQAIRPQAVVVGAVPHARSLVGSTTSYLLENAGSLRVLVFKY